MPLCELQGVVVNRLVHCYVLGTPRTQVPHQRNAPYLSPSHIGIK